MLMWAYDVIDTCQICRLINESLIVEPVGLYPWLQHTDEDHVRDVRQ